MQKNNQIFQFENKNKSPLGKKIEKIKFKFYSLLFFEDVNLSSFCPSWDLNHSSFCPSRDVKQSSFFPSRDVNQSSFYPSGDVNLSSLSLCSVSQMYEIFRSHSE